MTVCFSLKSTCDLGLFHNRDTGYGHFLKSTRDIEDPSSRAPTTLMYTRCMGPGYIKQIDTDKKWWVVFNRRDLLSSTRGMIAN